MTSPYLDRPLVALTIALPRLLAKIEAELADEKLAAAEEDRFRKRAELIRGLRVPQPIA
jgi:hypothetical protein